MHPQYLLYLVTALWSSRHTHGFATAGGMNELQIVESPKSQYITDQSSKTLSCKVFNAKQVRYKCNNLWVDDRRLKVNHSFDNETAIPFIFAELVVSRKEVEKTTVPKLTSEEDVDEDDWRQQKFYCECYGEGGNSQLAKSAKAFVEIAFMHDEFIESPYDQSFREGDTAQLRCIPPNAVPKAEITWYKDDKIVEKSTEGHIIYSNDGSLLLTTVSLADEGRYFCVAKNMMGRKQSDTAIISVYVNGGWSQWSDWSDCNVDCDILKEQLKDRKGNQKKINQLLPKQTRQRECNNPAPLNNGRPCAGTAIEDRLCEFSCPVNGHWSSWSSWSECTTHCYEMRTRACTAPPPLNGGTNCTGNASETRSCSLGSGHCRGNANSPTFDTPPLETQLAMYAGLGSVVLLLLLIFLFMLILFCRWKRCCLGARRDDVYFAENSGHVRTVLLQQKQRLLGDPDGVKIIANGSEFYTLTTTASPAHAVIHPSTFTLRSVRSANSGYSSTRQGAGSRTALITECSSSNSSNGKTTLGECSSSQASDENYATLYDYVGDASERYGSIQMTMLPQVFTPVYFNTNGGRVELQKSGVSLLVPENALTSEQTVYIAISDDVTDRPKLPEGDTVLSATVMTGLCDGNEDETTLHRPIIISFNHCANNFPRDNWIFMLYAKKNYDGIWEMVAKIGEENINTPVYCHLEHYRCHVMTEQFGKLLLVGRSKKLNGMATKRVRIAAFGPTKPSPREATVRVYCIPETGVAFRRVIEREENSGVLLAQVKDFLLRETGSLCVRLDSSTSGLYSSPPTQYYEIQETHRLWCLQSGVHCDLNLATAGDTLENRKRRILIYQRGNADARQTIEVDLQKPLVCDELQDESPLSIPFQLDADIRWRLSTLLDTPTDPEKDWRGLAKKLDLYRYVQYFATRPGVSPTSLLLDMWEAMKAGSKEAIFDLLQKLRSMGRPDAVVVLDQYLS